MIGVFHENNCLEFPKVGEDIHKRASVHNPRGYSLKQRDIIPQSVLESLDHIKTPPSVEEPG